MGISQIEYTDLLKGQGKPIIQTQTIRTHAPTPNPTDYRRGYIVRYFIQRINDDDSIIYEVNENDYKKFSLDTFYNTVNIDWRLMGNIDNLKRSNEKSVMLGSKKIKNLKFYLPNYLQFTGY